MRLTQKKKALFYFILIFHKLSFKKERSRRTVHLQRISKCAWPQLSSSVFRCFLQLRHKTRPLSQTVTAVNYLTYLHAKSQQTKLTGMVLCREVQPYILLFCCFTFFLKCYQSLADNTLTGWELTSFRTLLFNHSSKTHQVQIKPEHGKQTDQFYMPWWHHNDIRRIKVCTFSLQFVFQAWEENKQYSHSTK